LRAHSEAVGPREAARELDEGRDFAHALAYQRQPPDRILPRRGDEDLALIVAQNDAVRAGHGIDQEIEPSIGAQPEHAPARVLVASLPLVGEIEISTHREGQVVDALEPLGPVIKAKWSYSPARRVKQHDSMFVIG